MLEYANRRDEERTVVVLASTSCLGLLCADSFGVVQVLWEIRVYMHESSERSPPTLVLLPGAYSKTKRMETN